MISYFVSRNACPACTSIEFKEMYSNSFTESPIREYLQSFYSAQGKIELEYLEGAHYTLVECQTCGLVFQQEIPNGELMEILYEQWIDPEIALRQYEDRGDLGVYADRAESAMQMIAGFGVKPSQLDFLDFGMGWGKWALMIKAFGCNSYGLDLSSTRDDHAQSCGVTVLSRADLSRHGFDVITADWVFEHIPNPLETLIDLKTALKPGGIIRISVPTVNDLKRRLRVMDWNAAKDTENSLNAVAPLEHINCFSRAVLLRMAAIVGMREVHIRMDRRFQLAKKLNTLRRISKNFILPAFPSLRRDQILLSNISHGQEPRTRG